MVMSTVLKRRPGWINLYALLSSVVSMALHNTIQVILSLTIVSLAVIKLGMSMINRKILMRAFTLEDQTKKLIALTR